MKTSRAISTRLRKLFPNSGGFLINAANMLLQVFKAWKKSRRVAKRTPRTWTSMKHDKFDNDLTLVDVAIGIYLRCILEAGYETVIEVGTRDGKRIRCLKKLLPSLNCFGLDIQDKFKNEFEADGVKFAHNNIDFFKIKRNKALVITRGCLSYYELSALLNFIETLHEYQYDVAFVEPVCKGQNETIVRSPFDQSFYHPYCKVFSEAGIDIVEGGANTRFTFAPSLLEYWHLNLARCPVS